MEINCGSHQYAKKYHLIVMKNHLQIFTIFLLAWTSYSCAAQSIDSTFSMYSQILGEMRSITVGLPGNYKTSTASYETIYVLDAEYKYDICRSSHKYFEISTRLPGTIMIGIANSSKENRLRDLLPSNFQGQDSVFRSFIEIELIPFIEKHFRCNSTRTIFGHSHGGVFAVNTLLNNPKMFDKYIAADASFQIVNSNLPDSLTIDLSDKSLYICSTDGLYGFGEEISSDMLTNNMIFQNYRLQNRDTGLRFFAEHIRDDHSHSLITAFHRGYRWVMDWPISKDTVRK